MCFLQHVLQHVLSVYSTYKQNAVIVASSFLVFIIVLNDFVSNRNSVCSANKFVYKVI